MTYQANTARNGVKDLWPAAAVACLAVLLMAAGWQQGWAEEREKSGREMYLEACAACHGNDGRGASARTLGHDTVPPKFTNCDFAPREANLDWYYVAGKGGPARGFSTYMPAFGEHYSKEQLIEILDYVRSFCTNKRWPRGELNLPRALVTTKAYPEDEVVVEFEADTERYESYTVKGIYEQRLGERSQFEVAVPYSWLERADPGGPGNERNDGFGDVALGLKHVLFADHEQGGILSAGLELVTPTGDRDRGLGDGTFKWEPYLSAGLALPHDLFLQSQAGLALAEDNTRAADEWFFRLAGGQSLYTGEFGRRWTPQVELVGSKALNPAGEAHWDIVPQLQVTLNPRQHVRLAVGARIPVHNTLNRETTYMAYILWDWFDGMFWEGW